MNDVKGCYNRIVHTVAILVLMSFGLNHTAARILFQVLQTAEHNIKTGYGVSKTGYGETNPPAQGSGQGNGLGPTVWALISSRMMQMMKNKGHGVNMRSSLSLAIICIVCVGFVDDTDLPMSGATVDTPGEDIQQDFQTSLDRWAGALHVTGGELDPKKSWCYFIDFQWIGTAW